MFCCNDCGEFFDIGKKQKYVCPNCGSINVYDEEDEYDYGPDYEYDD